MGRGYFCFWADPGGNSDCFAIARLELCKDFSLMLKPLVLDQSGAGILLIFFDTCTTQGLLVRASSKIDEAGGREKLCHKLSLSDDGDRIGRAGTK